MGTKRNKNKNEPVTNQTKLNAEQNGIERSGAQNARVEHRNQTRQRIKVKEILKSKQEKFYEPIGEVQIKVVTSK